MARVALFALALLLAACAGAPVERVVVQEVKLPVAVMPAVPAEIEACRYGLIPPRFEQDAAGRFVLPAEQVKVYLNFVAGFARCDDAWRAWSAPDVSDPLQSRPEAEPSWRPP